MTRFNTYAAFAALALLTACSESGDSPFEPTVPVANFTVDASAGFAFVDLTGDEAAIRTVADPVQASNWDLGFNATTVILNGGDAGPGQVTGYCICQNASATPAQVMGFNAAGQLAAFEAVTASQIPASAAQWKSDVFATSKWYKYNLTGSDHQVWPTFDVYLVKQGTTVYKVQLTNYYGPGGEPRRISFRYARLTP